MSKHILILSPPFYSHFMPLIELGIGLKAKGIKVTVACSQEFQSKIEGKGLLFAEINISRNRNTGIAGSTAQEASERMRLEQFFSATHKGPAATLTTQLQHRRADTFSDPEDLLETIRTTNHELKPDIWIVDLLSYAANLCLHCLGFPYVTFCPPHPASIPGPGADYNIPLHWPRGFEPEPASLKQLVEVSQITTATFTCAFNNFIKKSGSAALLVKDAFNLVSDKLVMFLYPDFDDKENPSHIYLGSCFGEEKPDLEWLQILDNRRRKILLSFGTFLSERTDVLKQMVDGILSFDPEAMVILAAGRYSHEFYGYPSDRVIVRDFVPQKAIIKSMDLIIHHGGCNSFTEGLFYGIPMIILPFSSDQFNIAYDAERLALGVVLDPNNLDEERIKDALNKALYHLDKEPFQHWSKVLQSRGADYGADILKSILE